MLLMHRNGIADRSLHTAKPHIGSQAYSSDTHGGATCNGHNSENFTCNSEQQALQARDGCQVQATILLVKFATTP